MNSKAIRVFASFLSILLLLPTFFVQAHSGRTDSNGGHWDRSSGTYHYHDGRYAGQEQSPSTSPPSPPSYSPSYGLIKTESAAISSKEDVTKEGGKHMNWFGELCTVFGMAALFYAVASLLHSWYLYLEDNNKWRAFQIVLIVICFCLWICSLPAVLVFSLIRSIREKRLLNIWESEQRKKEQDKSDLIIKCDRNKIRDCAKAARKYAKGHPSYRIIRENLSHFSDQDVSYTLELLDIDYKENAVKKARSYKRGRQLSAEHLFDILVNEDLFFEREAMHALKTLKMI